jgi:penicillin-binding protein-related factor A (putative recombinase)
MTNISNANIGANFERYFEKCASLKGWRVTRVPDGAKHLGKDRIVRVKSPFDFVLTKKGKALFVDTKTTQGETYSYSSINQAQVEELLAIEKQDHTAGFIINFRQNGLFCFVKASELSEVCPGQSIRSKNLIDLGKEIDIERLFVETKETL